jgi:hypothetical protein
MPDDPRGLFPDEAKPRGRSLAPTELTPPQLQRIHAWAEQKVPWVSRGAFESYTTVEAHVEEILEWWDGAGKMKRKWVSTIQNRIRKVERLRLERLARSGSQEAVLALRQPAEWARRYDRKLRATQAVQAVTTEGEGLIRPAGGKVLRLHGPKA